MSPRRRRGRLLRSLPASQGDLADLRGRSEAHRFAIAVIAGVLGERDQAFAAIFEAALRELPARLVDEGLSLAEPAIAAALEEAESLSNASRSPQAPPRAVAGGQIPKDEP